MDMSFQKTPARLIAVVVATALSLSGCGKSELANTYEESVSDNQVVQEVQESVQDESIPSEFAELSKEILENVPPLEDVTQEQLYDMSLDEFKALIYTYCPNYREVYQINGDMTDELWESLRYVVSYQLYGTVTYSPSIDEVSDEDLAKAQITTMITDLDNLGVSYRSLDELETDDLQMLALSFKNASSDDVKKCLAEYADVDVSSISEEDVEVFREAMATEFQLAYKIRSLLIDFPEIDIDELTSEVDAEGE